VSTAKIDYHALLRYPENIQNEYGGETMKTGIHPAYGPALITCACGEVVHTRSTIPMLKVEICSKCHPLFTGRQKLIDSEGRVERFQRKYGRKTVTLPAAETKTEV
jgi:large subunit ribosomal protein L31